MKVRAGDWREFVYAQLVDLGFQPILARQHAHTIVLLSEDEVTSAEYRHVLLRPDGSMTLLSHINPERISTDGGIAIVIDIAALRSSYEAQ